jgi:hypothetical protein
MFDVWSGISQESVIGQLLFLIFVNELPEWERSGTKLFAEDIKVWTKCEYNERLLRLYACFRVRLLLQKLPGVWTFEGLKCICVYKLPPHFHFLFYYYY